MVCRAINRTRVIANRTRANNTAVQTGSYDASCFSATTCSVERKMLPARYFPLRAVCAVLRGVRGTAGITQKQQRGVAREQQAEAAKLDATTRVRQTKRGRQVAAKRKELGYV